MKINGERVSERRERLQKEAEERKIARALRSPQEQLVRLDKLLGVGVGAKKERARLQKFIDDKAGQQQVMKEGGK